MASFVEDATVDANAIILEQDFSTLFDRSFSPDLFDSNDSAMSSPSTNRINAESGNPAPLFSPEQQAWLETWLASRAGGSAVNTSIPGSSANTSVAGSSANILPIGPPPSQSGKYTKINFGGCRIGTCRATAGVLYVGSLLW